MSKTAYYLLWTKRFLPLFIVQFLGAMNDNIFKNSIVILIAFKLAATLGWRAETLIAIASGVFILPFFLFSANAGQLADKLNKDLLIRWIKFFEVLILGIGATLSFYFESIYGMYLVLFLMGVHSTYFGPIKYSILPQHLKKDELLFGNGFIEAATFLAIMLGTIIGGGWIMQKEGLLLITILLLLFAFVALIVSFFIPVAKSADPKLKINYNIISETWKIFKNVYGHVRLFRTICGLSWFWFVGVILLSVIPPYVKSILGGNEQIVTCFLVLVSLGIAIGSIGCSRMLKGKLSAKYVPIAGISLTISLILISIVSNTEIQPINSLQDFLNLRGILILLGFFSVAVSGGFFSVPLYALLQYWSSPEHRARNISANNIINSFFIVLGSILAVAIYSLGGGIIQLLIIVAILNFFVTLYTITLVPEIVAKTIIRWIIKKLFKVKIEGLENFYKAGEGAVIIANHVSLIDPVLLATQLPEKLTYAISAEMQQLWWVKPFLIFVKVLPLDPFNPIAIKSLIQLAKQGERIVIFPEGRITLTGVLMKVYEGPGLIAAKAGTQLLPICIEGAQYTPFSYLKGKVKRRLFPKIKLVILPPRKFEPNPNKSGREARKEYSRRLYDIMAEMKFLSLDKNGTIFENLIEAAKKYGLGKIVLNDVTGKPLTYRKVLANSLILGNLLTKETKKGESIGLMLPNSKTSVLAYLGVQTKDRVAVIINYTSGRYNVLKACQTAQVNVLWTSNFFLKAGKFTEIVRTLESEGIKVKYLEELAKEKKKHYLKGLFAAVFPVLAHFLWRENDNKDRSEAPSTILFTSGTSGLPKGVVLSNKNIYSNIVQMKTIVDINSKDRIFNVLPIFHAFGLTGGMLAPILTGGEVFMYPTPLHYGIIPELIYQQSSTILFGTNTFLKGYAKRADPYDFYSVRYIFAGAEKVQDSTRSMYADIFGTKVFEGYGTTEASPVIAINTPVYNKADTVGRLLPGIEYKLLDVPEIVEGKELWVRGANVMLGYMHWDHPGKLHPLKDGWLNTGDIVRIDEQGFITIIGRTKRFAKIGAEMISLSAVEELVHKVWTKDIHACISKPHPQKGEILILVTEKQDAQLKDVWTYGRTLGISEMMLPKVLKIVKKISLLGSGKPDYLQLSKDIEV